MEITDRSPAVLRQSCLHVTEWRRKPTELVGEKCDFRGVLSAVLTVLRGFRTSACYFLKETGTLKGASICYIRLVVNDRKDVIQGP